MMIRYYKDAPVYYFSNAAKQLKTKMQHHISNTKVQIILNKCEFSDEALEYRTIINATIVWDLMFWYNVLNVMSSLPTKD